MPFYDSYHDNIIINGPIIESNRSTHGTIISRREDLEKK